MVGFCVSEEVWAGERLRCLSSCVTLPLIVLPLAMCMGWTLCVFLRWSRDCGRRGAVSVGSIIGFGGSSALVLEALICLDVPGVGTVAKFDCAKDGCWSPSEVRFIVFGLCLGELSSSVTSASGLFLASLAGMISIVYN